jgi:hypothetical protein
MALKKKDAYYCYPQDKRDILSNHSIILHMEWHYIVQRLVLFTLGSQNAGLSLETGLGSLWCRGQRYVIISSLHELCRICLFIMTVGIPTEQFPSVYLSIHVHCVQLTFCNLGISNGNTRLASGIAFRSLKHNHGMDIICLVTYSYPWHLETFTKRHPLIGGVLHVRALYLLFQSITSASGLSFLLNKY